ncbi:WD40-like Beta Propeller Repeat [Luteitalea pratensis]|uniref:WD40-like Beta Propeller Repeat n=1 Tax=Luteitalea pratensis TaxID=1855912 RepID=A0A143PNI1_LUTPR|nr:PD40 domain-containing protein [Luteitalea pratensis]AMY09319.1 WD40-like Beta Propeller Repeat [Luteitalea pratensis]
MALLRTALTATALLAIASSYPTAAPKYSAWTAPVNLGAPVNSTFADAGPAVSKEGLSLYFHSERPGGQGSTDIWVSQRAGEDEPWGPPANIGTTVNTLFIEAVAALSRDEHWLFFSSDRPGPSIRFDGLEMFFFSDRPGGFGAVDLWASTRATILDAWSAPTNLGAIVNSVAGDFQPYIASDRETLYFGSARPGGVGGQDIWVTRRTKR